MSLSLSGRRVVVVGGGRVATRRVAELVEVGARVEVVAPRLSDELEAAAASGAVAVHRRTFRADDLTGAWVAFAATDDPEVNGTVVEAAEERRCFVSSARGGAPGGSRRPSLRPMAVLRRGDLEVAVGTSGRSPALATWLVRRLEADLGPEYGVLLDLVGEIRDELKAEGCIRAAPDWYGILDSGILGWIRTGRLDDAREGLRTCLSSSSG